MNEQTHQDITKKINKLSSQLNKKKVSLAPFNSVENYQKRNMRKIRKEHVQTMNPNSSTNIHPSETETVNSSQLNKMGKYQFTMDNK